MITEAFTIAITSTDILANKPSGLTFFSIQNNDATNPIWVRIGTGAATVANGWKLAAGESLSIKNPINNEIRAISTGGNVSAIVAWDRG